MTSPSSLVCVSPGARRRRDGSDAAAVRPSLRTGATTLDYVLIMTAILPFAALAMPQGRRLAALTFELTCTLIAWPFL